VGGRPAPRLVTFPGAPAWQDRLDMLRKILWSGLYAGVGAAATTVAGKAASSLWRVATHEEPPSKR